MEKENPNQTDIIDNGTHVPSETSKVPTDLIEYSNKLWAHFIEISGKEETIDPLDLEGLDTAFCMDISSNEELPSEPEPTNELTPILLNFYEIFVKNGYPHEASESLSKSFGSLIYSIALCQNSEDFHGNIKKILKANPTLQLIEQTIPLLEAKGHTKDALRVLTESKDEAAKALAESILVFKDKLNGDEDLSHDIDKIIDYLKSIGVNEPSIVLMHGLLGIFHSFGDISKYVQQSEEAELIGAGDQKGKLHFARQASKRFIEGLHRLHLEHVKKGAPPLFDEAGDQMLIAMKDFHWQSEEDDKNATPGDGFNDLPEVKIREANFWKTHTMEELLKHEDILRDDVHKGAVVAQICIIAGALSGVSPQILIGFLGPLTHLSDIIFGKRIEADKRKISNGEPVIPSELLKHVLYKIEVELDALGTFDHNLDYLAADPPDGQKFEEAS